LFFSWNYGVDCRGPEQMAAPGFLPEPTILPYTGAWIFPARQAECRDSTIGMRSLKNRMQSCNTGVGS
jgi:hypothetical protein